MPQMLGSLEMLELRKFHTDTMMMGTNHDDRDDDAG